VKPCGDYLERILKARVYDVAVESPLEPAARLSARLGNRVLLKREDLQPVFSFKLRGAYNKIAQLPAGSRARGVICSSAGNHAQGVALAGRALGVRAVVVMPSKRWVARSFCTATPTTMRRPSRSSSDASRDSPSCTRSTIQP
jgi:threonine dehydratase